MNKILGLVISLVSLSAFAGHPDEDARIRQMRETFSQAKPITSIEQLKPTQPWTCLRFAAIRGDDAYYDIKRHLEFHPDEKSIANRGDCFLTSFKITPEGLAGEDKGYQYKMTVRILPTGELVTEWLIGPRWFDKENMAAPGIVDPKMFAGNYAICRLEH